MASWQSKPREFSKYNPEIDVDQYSKELSQKNTEYKQGVQKVENTISSVANLPVAKEDDRKYLQGIVDQLTTDVNNRHGADWSDQHLTNTVAQKAQSLSGDPKVRQAASSALYWKGEFEKYNTDEKRTKGANTINQKALMDDFNSWSGSGKVGDAPNSEGYFNYHDIPGDFEKYYKDKNPNTKISVQYAGYQYNEAGNIMVYPSNVSNEGKIIHRKGDPIYSNDLAVKTWDAKTEKWKTLSATDVMEDVQGFLKQHPDYQKQMELNGRYAYHDLPPQRVIEKAQEIYGNVINVANREYKDNEIQLGLLPAGDKNRTVLEKKQLFLKDKIKEAKVNLQPENIYSYYQLLQSNTEAGNKFKKQLYEDDLLSSLAKKHAYADQLDVSFSGLSPWQKQMEEKKFSNDVVYKQAQLKHMQNQDRLANKKDAREESAAEAKQRQTQSLTGASEYGADTRMKEPWQEFNEQYQDRQLGIKNSMDQFSYDKWGESHPEYFEVGNDFKAHPTKEGKVQIDKLYNELEYAATHGGKTTDGHILPIDPSDHDHFAKIQSEQKLAEVMKTKIDEAKTIWGKRPEAIAQGAGINKMIDFVEQNKEWGISGNDVRNYVKAANEIKKNLENSSLDELDKENMQMQVYANHFLGKKTGDIISNEDRGKINGILGSITSINKNFKGTGISPLETYAAGTDKQNEFFNHYMTSKGYLVNKQFIPWQDVNKKSGKVTAIDYSQVNPLLHGQKSSLVDAKSVTSVGYVQDPATGDYKLVLMDANKNTEEFPITQKEAQSHGFINLQNEDNLSQLLRMNINQTGTMSTTHVGPWEQRDFGSAMFLTTKELDGQPHEIKYHVKHANGTYYLEFWVKNIMDEKDNGHPYIDPKTHQKVEAKNGSLSAIRIALDNFSNTGSTATPGSYYSKSSYEASTSTEENPDQE